MEKFKLKKNDEVRIIAGREKGKQGKILTIDHKKKRVFVEGLNLVKKAMKKTQQNQKGGIAEIESPLHISNVMIICKKCGPTRIGYKVDGQKKNRVCRKCGEQL